MISVQQAEALILQHLPSPAVTTRSLADALSYCLAHPVHAERDHPPFDRITHDGIALNLAALPQDAKHLPVECYAAAGAQRKRLAHPAHCIEVATGAPLPEGCDTVIPYEGLKLINAVAEITSHLPALGNCLHRQGSDAKAGQQLLARGARVGILETAILASNGIAQVPVYQKPSIGILTTGDELVDMDALMEPHQIRRSNDITLKAALDLNGFVGAETAWEPDDKTRIHARLQRWLGEKDVLLITGGVSRGTYDYIPQILETLGVKNLFHHVAQRPGKPLWFGTSREGKPVFGLPGNPASSLTCLRRYVIPALCAMSGGTAHAQEVQLATSTIAHDTLALFRPVSLNALYAATPMQTMGSGDFTSLAGSDGFVELPPRAAAYATDESVRYFPWRLP
jgi:molybdopterin molybdotransferase